jgi:hypothetical protein
MRLLAGVHLAGGAAVRALPQAEEHREVAEVALRDDIFSTTTRPPYSQLKTIVWARVGEIKEAAAAADNIAEEGCADHPEERVRRLWGLFFVCCLYSVDVMQNCETSGRRQHRIGCTQLHTTVVP